MMPGMTRKATTQGIASSSANSMARFCAERAPAWSPADDPARHLRHQHGAHRNTDDADRQLVDAVGVIERRQCAGGEEACDDGVGEQRQLRAGRADRCRHQRLEETPHVVVPGERVKRRHDAGPPGIATDQGGLQHARNQHAPGGSVAGTRKQPGHRERRHHRHIEQRRCRRRRRKAIDRVEDAAPQRHQRDQQQIRKRDPRQANRERELLRVAGKAGRQQVDRLRREQERQRQQHDLRRQQQGEDAVAEQFCRRLAALGANARIGRNERGIEGAFGENGAEMVRQPERDKEGVGNGTGADDRRQHDVAHETGQAREQRIAADGEDAIEHCCLFPSPLWGGVGVGVERFYTSVDASASPPDPLPTLPHKGGGS